MKQLLLDKIAPERQAVGEVIFFRRFHLLIKMNTFSGTSER